MLENVRFFNFVTKDLFLFLFLIIFTSQVYANEKNKIIEKLNLINSLEFSFNQTNNEQIEKGICLLQFPGKLKCTYFDEKQKELVINKKKLAITQKKYKKTYLYPINKSPFLNILYKDKLLEIVKSGKINVSSNVIKLSYSNENKISIFFNKLDLSLKGWEIIDQYNNNIFFDLKIISLNDNYNKETFAIPKID